MNESMFEVVKREALKIIESDLCHNTTTLLVGLSNKKLSSLTGLNESSIEDWKNHLGDQNWAVDNITTMIALTSLQQTLMFLFSHPELDGKPTVSWFEE